MIHMSKCTMGEEFKFHTLTFIVKDGVISLVARLQEDGPEVLCATLGVMLDKRAKFTQTLRDGAFELMWEGKALLRVEYIHDKSSGKGHRSVSFRFYIQM